MITHDPLIVRSQGAGGWKRERRERVCACAAARTKVSLLTPGKLENRAKCLARERGWFHPAALYISSFYADAAASIKLSSYTPASRLLAISNLGYGSFPPPIDRFVYVAA